MQTRLPSQQVTISTLYLSRLQSRDCCCSMGAMVFALALRKTIPHTPSPAPTNSIHTAQTPRHQPLLYTSLLEIQKAPRNKNPIFFFYKDLLHSSAQQQWWLWWQRNNHSCLPCWRKRLWKCCLRFPTCQTRNPWLIMWRVREIVVFARQGILTLGISSQKACG